jgi:hypothetical protein
MCEVAQQSVSPDGGCNVFKAQGGDGAQGQQPPMGGPPGGSQMGGTPPMGGGGGAGPYGS